VVAQAEVGVRRAGHHEPVTAGDRWHLGSDTKAMTATLAALLVDEGKLRWSSTLGEVLSDWKVHPALAKVTLDMLLAHRGGLPANAGWWSRFKMMYERDAAASRRRAVRAALRDAPKDVGAFRYSNLGYMVAGVMLERVTGMSWEALITQRLFAPLGMTSCGFGPPGTPGQVDQPWPHRAGATGQDPQPVPPEGRGSDNPRAIGPAGSVHCSLRDWSRFVALHLGQPPDGRTLVSPASLAHLQEPWPGGNYARGWLVGRPPWAQGSTLAHSGSNTLNFARVAAAPSRQLAFLLVTNVAGARAEEAIETALRMLIERYTP
jgi:D-alanyl-D-alanine carboxypeptidase